MPSDEQIVSIADGDQGAFRSFHRELHRPLFYYAHNLTGDVHAAEDVVQEAFVKFWDTRSTFASAMAAKVYLYCVVRNLVRNHVRNTLSRRRIIGSIGAEAVSADADDLAMIAAETCSLVREAVGALPARTRRVIELSMNNLTVGEIADRMGLSPNSVKTLKQAGYRSLRGKLGGVHSLLPILLSI